MRLTDSSSINTLQSWCIGIFLAAVLGLSTWTRMAPDRSDLVMIRGTLDRVSVVWFGGKSKTRAFALRITPSNGAQETVYLHESSVYDRSRNIYDIAKVEALLGRTVTVHTPPAQWSINSLYDKRVLALAAGSDIVLTYDAATRSEHLFRWWLAGRPEWDVRMTNVSGSYAAMNLAGPRSREVLKRLTDADLSSDAMPYLAANECTIAGVSAIVLRIGFVGELGYEIHVPSQFGLHVWEAIMEAGREFSIAPFGLEAQRVLRLEKKHLLPGIDTDALSNPLEADMPWIVKLDKEDFIGKESLARAQQRGDRNKLVGFRLSESVMPDLASLVLCDGKLGGRITSCGYSPAVGGTIGLAWVPANLAGNGQTIQIQVNGRLIPAVVQDEPFYDPSGEKLKS